MSIFLWLLAVIIVRFVYFPLNARTPRLFWNLPIDEKIPLVPAFIVPYMLYVPYEIFTVVFLWSNQTLLTNYLQSYLVTNILALIFWYFFPNGVARLKLTGQDFLTRSVSFVHQHDGSCNGFPSGHVFGAVTTTYFLILSTGSYLWLIPGILISISTVFVKQHYLVDIPGGITWSFLGIWLVNLIK